MATTVKANGDWLVDVGDQLTQDFELTENGGPVDNWDDVVVQVDVFSARYGTLTLRSDDASSQVIKQAAAPATTVSVTLTEADTSANYTAKYRIVVIDPTEDERTTHKAAGFRIVGNYADIAPISFSPVTTPIPDAVVSSTIDAYLAAYTPAFLDADDIGVTVEAAGAAAAAQAAAVQRANHTGTQAQSTVTNLVTDLAAKAPLASPTFTGTVTVPTGAVAGAAVNKAQLDALSGTYVPQAGYRVVQLPTPTGTDDGAAIQAVLNQAASGPIKVVGQAGAAYIARNLQILANTWLDLGGCTVTYGGSHGTVAPLESIPVVLYAQGTSGTPLRGIRISGGEIIGQRPPTVWADLITNGQDAIQLNYCHGALVEFVYIHDHVQDAIVLSNSTGARVEGCRIEDCNDGAVELRAGSGYTVANNVMTRVRDGVPAKPDVEDVTVVGNVIQTFGEGGVLYPARRWYIAGNKFSTTTTSDGMNGALGYGVACFRHPSLAAVTNTIEDVVITGNSFRGFTGTSRYAVKVDDSNGQTLKRIEVSDNAVSACYGGLAAKNDTALTGNGIDATQEGISISGAGCEVIGNRVVVATNGTGIGISLTGSDNVASGNNVTVTGTGNQAISVAGPKNVVSNNRTLAAGTCSGQHVAVSGDDNVVNGNVCAGAQNQGIRITGTGDRNVVSSNRVRDVLFNGVQVQAGAVSNLIIGNVLLNNPTPLSDSGTTTTLASNVTV